MRCSIALRKWELNTCEPRSKCGAIATTPPGSPGVQRWAIRAPDSILSALREHRDGLTRWEISNHFGRNKPAAEIDRAINTLAERGLIRSVREETGGRTVPGIEPHEELSSFTSFLRKGC